jgi:hypothetical protein
MHPLFCEEKALSVLSLINYLQNECKDTTNIWNNKKFCLLCLFFQKILDDVFLLQIYGQDPIAIIIIARFI